MVAADGWSKDRLRNRARSRLTEGSVRRPHDHDGGRFSSAVDSDDIPDVRPAADVALLQVSWVVGLLEADGCHWPVDVALLEYGAGSVGERAWLDPHGGPGAGRQSSSDAASPIKAGQ